MISEPNVIQPPQYTFPFLYNYNSDNGTYYGSRATAGMTWFEKTGDASYMVMQREIYALIKSNYAKLMFEDEDNFPSLYFNFNSEDAETSFLKTYGKYLKHIDIRRKIKE